MTHPWRPTAIVFDAVGTLIVPDPPVAQAYADAGRHFGSQLNEEQISSRFHTAFADQEELDRARGDWATDERRERDRWRAIVGDVFEDVPQIEPLFTFLWDHFAQARHWRVVDGAEHIWSSLQARQIRLAIASNFDERLDSICRHLSPLSQCSDIFVSSRLGVRKPGRGFFDQIAAALGVEPVQLLMIGDSLQNDVHAARAAGWQAMWFNPDKQELDPSEPPFTHIEELPELLL